MCKEYNIKHIFTSVYHPEANGQVERFHRVLNDMLSKLSSHEIEAWDDKLPDVLAAYRIGISETTKFSPYFLLYGRDPILPIDNILKPRRPYWGDDTSKLAIQQQHQVFSEVRKNVREARKRRDKNYNKRTVDKQFKVGDPVYLYNNNRQSKLDAKWKTHYRIVEKHSQYTYTIKNQLSGDIKKVHAKHLQLANLVDWPDKISKVVNTRGNSRRATYVVSPDEGNLSSSDPMTSSEEEGETAAQRPLSSPASVATSQVDNEDLMSTGISDNSMDVDDLMSL